MRKKIIAGNWKLNKTPAETVQLIQGIRSRVVNIHSTEIIICPPFVSLVPASRALEGTKIKLGAQNLFWEREGAFTGEVSAPMLKAAGCQFVIIGHSERRQYFQETDETVRRRLKAALAEELTPIVCVGETLEQREARQTFEVIGRQLETGLADLDAGAIGKIVLAYEPVWAIGTGKNASPEQAQEVHLWIRQLVSEKWGRPIGDRLQIQYGGSVKPANAGQLLRQPDVDGALVGGASLDAASFAEIITEAEKIMNLS